VRFLLNNLLAMLSALFPLKRTKAIAPIPAGVLNAQMVSSLSKSFIAAKLI
jgi:hypothetical protein